MSAGKAATLRPTHTFDTLAPRFAASVQAAIDECNAAGLDAIVYETYRSPELQAAYYTRGRSVIPPVKPVTNASSNLYSWHGYGLAVDVISKSMEWDAPVKWFADVAEIFKRHECKWGGDWTTKDRPHFQWAACKPTPSERARAIIAIDGVHGVWMAVGAV